MYSFSIPPRFALTLLAGLLQTVYAHAADDAADASAGPTQTVEIKSTLNTASSSAPSKGSLDARSALSEVSDQFVRDFTSPVADYSQVLQMAPGMFSYSSNGVGLGDNKTTIRGLSDGNSVIAFDGIPFNDTNGVSHHAWVFFPSQFTGGAVIDRSPGSAATIGQATYGGSINLLSRDLDSTQRTSATGSYGTWNTKLVGLEHATGQFGPNGSSNLLINAQKMKSDGYQTYNKQKRDAASLKYRYQLSDDTAITLFSSWLNLTNNTPAIKGVTRANVEQGNYNTLLSGDPTKGNYWGFNFYDISTAFNYLGVTSNLGGGWKLEDKAYVYRYWNKQNYNNSTTVISSSSAVDKLNSYLTKGNLLRLRQESSLGVLRTGVWYDYAKSFRYQIPSDPRTWVNQAAPNFSETYQTTTVQPYVEYEFHVTPALSITPGVKYASYKQDFRHLQDNGGAVGPLGGVYNKTTGVITGGAPFIDNSVKYTDTLPSLDMHYQIAPTWTAYAQIARGDQIPSTGVFDTLGAKVGMVPKATKSTTTQAGTVWQSDKWNLSADIYRIRLDSPYSSSPDPVTGEPVYFLNGKEISQGVETEGTVMLGSGFSLYANATVGTTKYDTGKWVAGAPADTETLSLNYQHAGWNGGVFVKRVGKVYADNGSTHEAFGIDPVTLANLFVNYRLKNPMPFAKLAKLQLGVNNLFNRHSIVDVAAAGTKTSSSAAPSPADLLTVLPERSVSATLTIDF
ncbi:TonB-dependent receptor [Pseudoduganella sp. FT25W]|uniref:TonB-dependent receptor n=1 Tax=Duganella alba TaxID=2666081 RepID=A0A6L5Q9Z7_9BURK|nr:TonB-dependent receptor [Duganella alba]MRX06633.1 TonB-dependent receptor [Duganella alba]MRX18017.1 TonB-dependent receptor [Duganella alba]